ncbi:hypothetical protein P7C73_g2795, partial [Tremellales sp. Uapishka_1]
MADEKPLDSSATKALASRLARYAYIPTATSSTPSPSPSKRKIEASSASSPSPPKASAKAKSPKKPRGFAAPEVYQHLRPLNDIIAEGMDSRSSSAQGHHFAHPTNKYWRALHGSGITARLLRTEEDHLLSELYHCGLTVLVDRPTAEQAELSTMEMRLNTSRLLDKVLKYRPRVVCFVGKKIWDVFESVVRKTAGPPLEIEYAVKEESGTTGGGAEVKEDGRDLAIEHAVKEESGSTGGGTEVKEDGGGVKVEVESLEEKTATTSPKKSPKAKSFDWTKPRSLRLPLPRADETAGKPDYCYFWVVPNTSGLERTTVCLSCLAAMSPSSPRFQLPDQIVLFGHLKAFSDGLKESADDVHIGMAYRDISVGSVAQTVAALQAKIDA